MSTTEFDQNPTYEWLESNQHDYTTIGALVYGAYQNVTPWDGGDPLRDNSHWAWGLAFKLAPALSPEAKKLTRLTHPEQLDNLVQIAIKVLTHPELLDMAHFPSSPAESGPPDFELMSAQAGRVHCLAGHAIALKGAAGFELAYRLGPFVAGAMLLGIGIENFSATQSKKAVRELLLAAWEDQMEDQLFPSKSVKEGKPQ